MPPNSRNGSETFLGPVVCAVVFLLMTALTWRTWPDPIVDFGRELYLPWRVSLGEVLYRDVAHFSGPLSVYFNAMLFKLFGPSVMTLAYANLLIFAGVCVMVFRLSRDASDEVTATLATCAVIVSCGFGHLTGTGNFNWVTPYSHELTHGVALSIAVLLLIGRWLMKPSLLNAAMVGGVFGVVLLTKPEVGLAAGLMLVGLVVLEGWRHPLQVSVALLTSLLAPLVTWLLFKKPLGDLGALHAVLGGWRYVGDERIKAMPFYEMVTGISDVPIRFRTILLQFATIGSLLGLTLVLARLVWLPKLSTRRAWVWCGSIAAGLTLLTFADGARVWMWGLMPRSWTVLMPVLAIWLLRRAWLEPTPRRRVQALAGVFACGMLAKIFLAVSLQHYGFAHAMPALAVFVTAAMVGVPGLIAGRQASAGTARVATTAVIISFVIGHGLLSYRQSGRKTLPLGSGPNRILIYNDRGDIPLLLQAIDQRASTADTLVSIPEGAMLNFVTGLPNPTRFPVMMPVEAIMFGDADMARSLEIGAPTWLVVRRSSMMQEYAVRNIEHLPGVEAWIASNYDRVDYVQPGRSPLELYRRRDINPARDR